jgi:hypothetical protein
MTRVTTSLASAAVALALTGLPAQAEEFVAARNGPLAALGLGGGALICPSVADAQMAFRLMTEARNERLQDRMLGNLTTEMRGPSSRFDPAQLGCVIAPPGTPLSRDEHLPWFHVTGALADGARFSGQALPGTIQQLPQPCDLSHCVQAGRCYCYPASDSAPTSPH